MPCDPRRFADVGLQPGQAHRGRRRRLREDARPAPARDHEGARAAPPRLRTRGRPHARRMARRHPLPHRDRPDLDREAARVHPAVGHARPVDDDRLAGPGRASGARRRGRGDRGDGRRPVLLAGRARPAARRRHRRRRSRRAGALHGAASPTATASRSPARCSTSGRATATASTTCSSPTRADDEGARALPHRRRGPLLVLVDPAGVLPDPRRRPGRRDAARHGPQHLPPRPHPHAGLGAGPCAR